jgi:cytochrome P450
MCVTRSFSCHVFLLLILQEWIPERFLDHRADVTKNFFAFTQGPRRCMGQFFSITESKVVLSRLAQQFNFLPAKNLDQVERHPYVVPVCPHEPFLIQTERRK